MKSIVFISFFISIFSFSLYSGVVLKSETKYKSEKDSNKIEMTQYFDLNYSRIETKVKFTDKEKGKSEQETIVIIRNDKKVIWTIIPEQKGYCEFSFEEAKKYANSGSNLIPQGIKFTKDMKFEKTDKTEKIAGFLATEYDFKKDKEEAKLWTTEDEKLKVITDFYKNMNKLMGLDESKSKGVNLKFESKTNEIEYKTQVKSIKFQENQNSLFELPKDYEKLNKDIWKDYQKHFDPNSIIMDLKKQMEERAKEQVIDASKNAINKGLKEIIGFK